MMKKGVFIELNRVYNLHNTSDASLIRTALWLSFIKIQENKELAFR
jgi:hypothetical protein